MDHINELHFTESFLERLEPIVLLRDVLKRWMVILLAALAVGVGAYIITDAGYEPYYQSKMTFVVTDREAITSVYGNLSSTSSVASVFSDLLNSSLMRKTIEQEYGISLAGASIQSSVISDTNLINVTVRASDPRTAFLAAKALIAHHEAITYQVVPGVVMEVLQNPQVPSAPANPVYVRGIVQKAMLLAAVLTTALFLFLAWTRDSVFNSSEARKKLNCAFLGEIPHEVKYKTLLSQIRHRKTSILVIKPLTSFAYLEAIRKLRHRVERYMRGDKVLMVTSLLENEGKSTISVNLALALAQKKHRVLLIDCDLRKPACYAVIEQRTMTYGVRDVLLGRAEPADAVVKHNRSNLDLLLEKRGNMDSGNLVASAQLKKLLSWAREEYDYVVLDLPPMAQVTDAEVVKEFVDASVLVVRQNVALVPALNKAINNLKEGNSRLLGCVLNDVYSASNGYGYGYGYGRYRKFGSYNRKSGRE